MKILLVNNFYYNRGGDCTYLFSLKKLLEDKGHETMLFSMHHPDNFKSDYSRHFVSYINYDEEVKSKTFTAGLKVLNRAIYSREAKKNIEKLIKEEKPDIVHLQNIHHHITPSIFHVFKKYKIPVVWTLHDFTIICPNTSFIANNRICEKCKKRKFYMPLVIKCKKNSFGASAMAALETVIHRVIKINDYIDVFIAPSEFMQNKLIEYGLDKNKIVHINNFNNIDLIDAENKTGDYYLYIGRISHEKGILTLIDAAINLRSGKLKIVGDGPLKEEMIAYVKSKGAENNIEFLGHRTHEEVIDLLRESKFVVLTSECYENFPYSLLEASACGKPTIASRLGGIPEIVKNWQTGLLFKPGDSESLSAKIKFLLNHPNNASKMGENARCFIENEISAEKYYERLMEMYDHVLSGEPLNIS